MTSVYKYAYNIFGDRNRIGDDMEIKNPLYQNQGIHVIASIFTVDKGITKVLLIKRKNKPYNDMWALVGGALYNNETLLDGMKREIKEKLGITIETLEEIKTFSRIDRSPLMRMLAVSYIGIIDVTKVNILKETLKTKDADWFPIEEVKELAYDHNEILEESIKVLKKRIVNSVILNSLYPDGFTIPEIQKTYEAILDKKFDRRNFRKKLLSTKLIYDTNITKTFKGTKPAKIYKFIDKEIDENVF